MILLTSGLPDPASGCGAGEPLFDRDLLLASLRSSSECGRFSPFVAVEAMVRVSTYTEEVQVSDTQGPGRLDSASMK
jgi:hypothetical protein